MKIKIILKLSVFIFVALVLSGGLWLGYYLYKGGKLPESKWQDDVLWAQECGEDGLACCLDKEPTCSYGQECCFDPNDAKRHVCANTCECGVEGVFCCVGENSCEEGLACFEGNCLVCGGEDQPCCDGGETCFDSLVCHKNKCVECGQPGNPCCLPGETCVGMHNMDTSRTECYNDVCVFCGSNNGISCNSEPNCISSHLLNNGLCLSCGGYNQPCCEVKAGVDYECLPNLNLKCVLGFCSNID